MVAEDGIGPFSTQLQAQFACFFGLIKYNPPLLDLTLFNSFGVRFGVRDMKLLKQLFAYETTIRTNLRFRPQSSLGTGATGNGRVGSCRDNAPPLRQGNLREESSKTASVNAVGGPDGRTRPTQVNCHTHRQRDGAKDAVRLQPKWHAVRSPAGTMQAHGHRDCRCRGRG